MKNKITIVYTALAILLLASQSKAETVMGAIEKNGSSIQYKVDTQSGEYTLDFSNAFHPKFVISKANLDKVSCGEEKGFVEGGGGQLSIGYYKHEPINIDIVISDLNLNRNAIEKEISEDVLEKGFKIALVKTTDFYIESMESAYEWSDDALTVEAKANITQIIQEKFRKIFNDSLRSLNLSGRASFEMPIHLVVCDLMNKKLKIGITAQAEVVSDRKKEPLVSRQQLISINNEVVSTTHALKKSQASMSNWFNEDDKKLINSSAALAFGLAKNGFTQSISGTKHFETIFFKMFGYPSRLPKKMTESELEELELMLTDIVRTETSSITLNKELNVEVLK